MTYLDRPARLLLCMTSLHPTQGGIASTNRNIVRALSGLQGEGASLDFRVLTYHGSDPDLPPEYLEGRPPLVAQGCESNRARFATRYAARCLGWRPDLVFVDHLHLSVVPYLFRWMGGPPYVLSCHRSELEEPLSRLRLAAYRGARLRLSNSQFMAGRLRQMFPGAPVEPCEPAIDEVGMPRTAAKVDTLPDAFGTHQALGDKSLLIVARLAAGERYKGHDQLIDIMPAVVREVPEAQLVITGTGDDAERLQASARDGGAGQAVLFSGYATPEMLAGLFARCRAFAMPSRGEGFGVVYLEAMRFSKPCIASRVDGGDEVVLDGRTGLLVDPGNLEDIRQAATRLLGDADLAAQLGKAGRERFDAQYRFRHFRARLAERLASLVPALAQRVPAPASGTAVTARAGQ
jgi:phosphatidylinositol alpha-1,6-mannosyltransferase